MAMINWSAIWNLSGAVRDKPHRYHGHSGAEIETFERLLASLRYPVSMTNALPFRRGTD